MGVLEMVASEDGQSEMAQAGQSGVFRSLAFRDIFSLKGGG